MKTTLAAIVWFLALAFTLHAAEPNALTQAEKAEGWKLLFDGSTLTGWRGLKTEAPAAGWSVVDGALTVANKPGDLLTVDEFGDFELRVEWKVSVGANSGIIYRVGLGESATYLTGPEYQILDNVKAEDNKKPNHLAASLYDLVAAPKDFTKPVGEWNEARIIVRGWKVQHWLNGEKTVDVDLGSTDGKALIAGSKFKTMPKFATLARGHIALQEHGYPVSFRSIKIRELK